MRHLPRNEDNTPYDYEGYNVPDYQKNIDIGEPVVNQITLRKKQKGSKAKVRRKRTKRIHVKKCRCK
jgi:hypothetical protein